MISLRNLSDLWLFCDSSWLIFDFKLLKYVELLLRYGHEFCEMTVASLVGFFITEFKNFSEFCCISEAHFPIEYSGSDDFLSNRFESLNKLLDLDFSAWYLDY